MKCFALFFYWVTIFIACAQAMPVARYSIPNPDGDKYLDRMEAQFDQESHSWWFGIYDGHGESDWPVNYLRDNFKHFFDGNLTRLTIDNLKDVFEATFMSCQKMLTTEHRDVGGSTATVGFLHDKKLHVAWVGDSLAIKVTLLGNVVPLVFSHRPAPGSLEFERVKKALMQKPAASIDGFYFVYRMNKKNEELVGYTLNACRCLYPFDQCVSVRTLHGRAVDNEFFEVYRHFDFEGISLENIFHPEFRQRERCLRKWFNGFIRFLRSYDEFDLGIAPDELENPRFKRDREYFIPDLINPSLFGQLFGLCCCEWCPIFLRSFFSTGLLHDGICVQDVWRIRTDDKYVISVSRSLGDAVFADYGVIANPDYNVFDIEPNDKFLIFASDGLWDAFDFQEVADFVLMMQRRQISLDEICKNLCEAARQRGSTDDISVIVVDLDLC